MDINNKSTSNLPFDPALHFLPLGELWLDSDALCEQLRISPRTLRRWKALGKIKCSTVRNKNYYNRFDGEEMLRKAANRADD